MIETSAPRRRMSTQGTYMTFVKPQFRKGFEIPILPWQKGGIKSKSLWNSRDHIIRIIPGFDRQTGEVFRQNVNCNEYSEQEEYKKYLSDTFLTCRTVQNFGERKQSFIIDYAPGSPDDMKYGGDTVIDCFIKNVTWSVNAVAKGRKPKFGVSREMSDWMGRKLGWIRYAKPTLLVQALIFVTNGEPNKEDAGNGNYQPMIDENGEIRPLLAVVAMDGQKTLSHVLRSLVEPSDPGQPLDAITNNKYGGMAEMDGNKLFLNHVVEIEGQDKKTYHLRPSVQAPGKGWTPTPFYLSAEDVYSLWTPWNELIHYMTAEEQLKFLAAEFGAEAVNYLIGTDPIFNDLHIPDEIAAQGYGQYQKFVSGGYGETITIQQRPQPQQPQQPAYGGAAPGLRSNPAAVGLGGLSQRPSGLGGGSGLSGGGMSGGLSGGLTARRPQTIAPAAPAEAPETPAPAAPRNPLSGVQGNFVDREKLAASVSSIRQATLGQRQAVDEQADAASALLDDDTDYGDIPEEEYSEQE
jgi:hypothetical protein